MVAKNGLDIPIRGTIYTCFSEFFEILDSMDSKEKTFGCLKAIFWQRSSNQRIGVYMAYFLYIERILVPRIARNNLQLFSQFLEILDSKDKR
jgi:hypothetical protein